MGHKILVVDDEPDVREMMVLRLQSVGYDVATAENGAEGLRKIETDSPSLIICDVSMPVMDGFSFVREVKAKFPDFKTPIIMLTGKDRMQDTFAFEGVKNYLVKPCNAADLIAKIKSLLP